VQRLTRRNLLGLMAGSAGLALLSACGGSQPAAKPAESKPAESKPAEAPKPTQAAAPAAAPAATKPAEAAKPADAAKPAQAAPPTVAATGSQVKITLWSSFTGVNGDAQTAMVDRFNQSQKDVVVENQFQGTYEETGQKLLAALQAKQTPEISVLSDVWWFRLYLNKAIIPLDDLLKANNIDKGDYVDAFVNEGTRKNQLVWLPFARSTPLFYYNKDAWKEAGLPDRGPETYMELAEWGPKLVKKDGANLKQYGLAHSGAGGYIEWSFQSAVWGWGGSYSDPDFTIRIAEKPAVDAGTWLQKSVVDGWAVSPQNSDNDFRGGIAASMIASTGGLPGHEAAAKFQVGTAFLPKGPVQFGCPTGGAGLGILAAAPKEKQEAAFKYAAFATSPEQTSIWAQATGYMPVRKSAIDGAGMKDFYAKKPNFQTAGKQLAMVRGQDVARVFLPNGLQILQKGLDRITVNKEASETVMKDIAAALQKEADPFKKQVQAVEG
jgi:sn-glycerol 3-phosphate transport system substrate-binding protein